MLRRQQDHLIRIHRSMFHRRLQHTLAEKFGIQRLAAWLRELMLGTVRFLAAHN